VSREHWTQDPALDDPGPQPPGVTPAASRGGPPGLPAADRLTRRSTGMLVGAFLAITVAALMVIVTLPYAIMEPGPITNTLGKGADGKPLVEVTGHETYPTSGALDFTTVRVIGGPGARPSVWQVILAWLDPNGAVYPEDQLFPKGATEKQIEEQNTAEMADSQQEAIAVALRALGVQVPERVTIAEVAKDAPAAAVLKPGDELVTINGAPAKDAQAVRDAIGALPAGRAVPVVLKRNGTTMTVQAKTRSSGGRTVLGVFLATKFDFPFQVKINAGEVGGPSAGLMFTLGIYDRLTPGEMTGGEQIAGTGTIASDGVVGPIGGIQQKLAGAREGGAHYFLAPADNCDEVVGHVPGGLQVFKVSTFAQARTAVQDIAAHRTGGLATCGKS
jgi:PDZ domain-containing protein